MKQPSRFISVFLSALLLFGLAETAFVPAGAASIEGETIGATADSASTGAVSISPERQKVVDYMKKMATVKWKCGKDFSWYVGKEEYEYYCAGRTYYGIPYSQKPVTGRETVSYETFCDLIDGNKTINNFIGRNDCSYAVMQSIKQADSKNDVNTGTWYMYPGFNRLVKVGNYSYKSSTVKTCQDNGSEKMFKAYKQLLPGDIVVNAGSVYVGKDKNGKDVYQDFGHTMMIVENDQKNNVRVIHQSSGGFHYDENKKKSTKFGLLRRNEDRNSSWGVNQMISYDTLFNNYYIPLANQVIKSKDVYNYTVAYNANNGTGSAAKQTVKSNTGFTLAANKFSRSGYRFKGYYVQRACDKKWYTVSNGWQTISTIREKGYSLKNYAAGSTYTLNSTWWDGGESGDTYTFYAQWAPNTCNLEFALNYSGYNYLPGSGLGNNWSSYFKSRDARYTLSVDNSQKLNQQSSLKIVGTKAGASKLDLNFATSTNKGWADSICGGADPGCCGDKGDYILSFYAKSSVNQVKMYIRWGYGSYKTVTLSTGWKRYTIKLPKTQYQGASLHPYFDKAGTFYLNSMVLTDGTSTDQMFPEQGGWMQSQSYSYNGTYNSLPTPARSGYTFLGWFSKASGGTQITTSTAVDTMTKRVYAHWKKNMSDSPYSTITVNNNHLYELYDNPMTWEQAKAFCEQKGGHLVTISDSEENDTVQQLIEGFRQYVWLGLKYNESAKKWQWVTGEAVTYSKWNTYQPTNKDGSTKATEPYALIFPFNIGTDQTAGKWRSIHLTNYFASFFNYQTSAFICEYDPPEETEADYFDYNVLDDSTLEITGYRGEKSELEIPAAINGCQVSRIAANAFKDRYEFTRIVVPNGVTSIGDNAFDACYSVSSIVLPQSVNRIGKRAFQGCISLLSVNLPEGITVVEEGTFSGCKALTKIDLPHSLTKIEVSAFSGCGLTELTIPEMVTEIGDNAFKANPDLKSVSLPEQILTIGTEAIGYYTKYVDGYAQTSVVEDLTIYGYRNTVAKTYAVNNGIAFVAVDADDGSDFEYRVLDNGNAEITRYLGNNTDVVIPGEIDGNTVTSVGENAFEMNGSLISVEIADTVTDIQENAFANCESLQAVTLPASLKIIHQSAFHYCTALKSVDIPEGTQVIESNAFNQCYSLSDVSLHEGLTTIEDRAFDDCLPLNEITVPKSVTEIGNYALGYGGELDDYNNVINYGVNSEFVVYGFHGTAAERYANSQFIPFFNLDDTTFRFEVLDDDTIEITGYNGSDTTVSVPADIRGYTVSTINWQPFDGSELIEHILYPKTVTEIKSTGASQFTALKSIEIDYDNSPAVPEIAFVTEGGVLFNSDMTKLLHYPADLEDKIFTLPDTIEIIGEGAFCGNANIVSINTGNYLNVIEPYAFNGCIYLETLTGDGFINTVGAAAFAGCRNLQTVDIGYLNIIEPQAFQFCGKLDYSNIIAMNDSIEPEAFLGCESLSTVTVDKGVKEIGDFSLGYTFRYVAEHCYVMEQIEGFTIVGYPNSAAERYAEENGFEFRLIDNIDGFVTHENGEGTLAIDDYVGTDTDLVIPSTLNGKTVTELNSFMDLSRKDDIISIEIPGSVQEIGMQALANCSKLEKVILHEGVKVLFSGAFGYCPSLKNVTIPDSVEFMGSYVFEGCSSLKRITILNPEIELAYSCMGYDHWVQVDEENGYYAKVDGFMICGAPGSTAEQYARENGFTFLAIGENIIGDVNQDKKITIRDVTAFQRHLAELKPFTNEQLALADTNGDGAVNIDDATHLQEYLAEFDNVVLGKK